MATLGSHAPLPLIFQSSAGISTCRTNFGRWLLGYRRAGPSTPLDKSVCVIKMLETNICQPINFVKNIIDDNFAQE